MKRLIMGGCILTLLVYGCLKTEPVSRIPQITFKSFQLYDYIDTLLGNKIKRGVLEFSFIDGDADIGIITPFDSNQPPEFNYNVFLFPFKKVDGRYIKIDIDTTGKVSPPPFYRIEFDPKLTRVGQNKTIKGIISINIDYYVLPDYDTLRYDFYITDRAMHKSNIDSTSDVGFR
jgi:hypothetical protein